MMNERGKSDNLIVPERLSNKAPKGAAEAAEGSGLAKGNLLGQNTHRTQSRISVPSALERVRNAVKGDGSATAALMHHVYAPEMLACCYYWSIGDQQLGSTERHGSTMGRSLWRTCRTSLSG